MSQKAKLISLSHMHPWGKAEDALVKTQSENEIKFLVKNPVQNYTPVKTKQNKKLTSQQVLLQIVAL